jgi:anti-anti-sigma factor
MTQFSEALRLFITNAGSQSRLDVAGEVDLATVGDLRDHLDLLVTSGTGDVVVDMAAVTFCDAVGLHVLLDAHEALRTSGRNIRVVNPSRPVTRLLQLTAVDTILLVPAPLGRTTSANHRPRTCRSPGRPGPVDRSSSAAATDADR